MSWFGWLTKGHYEVTLLDRVIGFSEFAVVVFVALGALYAWAAVEKFRRRRHAKADK